MNEIIKPAGCSTDECPMSPVLSCMIEDGSIRHPVIGWPPVVRAGLEAANRGLTIHSDMAGSTKRICGWLRTVVSRDVAGVGNYSREEVLHFIAACHATRCYDQTNEQG